MRTPGWRVIALGTSLAAACTCSKSSPASSEAPVAASVPAKPVVAPPAHGDGVIRGTVTMTGTPPPVQALKRGSDPVCAKTPMNDEQLLVEQGKVQNVFVRVVDLSPSAPPTEALIVDQRDCMYRPRIQGAVAGQPVLIRNQDGTLHNVHGYFGTKTLFNNAQPARSNPVSKAFADVGVIKLKCDVHPWMVGFVGVAANPFFAVTDAAGAFEIKGLPAGTYTVETWHEKLGSKSQKVTVGSAPAAVTFTYSADDRGS